MSDDNTKELFNEWVKGAKERHGLDYSGCFEKIYYDAFLSGMVAEKRLKIEQTFLVSEPIWVKWKDIMDNDKILHANDALTIDHKVQDQKISDNIEVLINDYAITTGHYPKYLTMTQSVYDALLDEAKPFLLYKNESEGNFYKNLKIYINPAYKLGVFFNKREAIFQDLR